MLLRGLVSSLRAPCGIEGHSRLGRFERPHKRDVRHAPECRVEGLGLAQLAEKLVVTVLEFLYFLGTDFVDLRH